MDALGDTPSATSVEKAATQTQANQPTLKKNALGVWHIAFFVIAASAPVFVINVAFTNYQLGGIGAPSGYLIGGVFLLFFALAFTAMTKYIKNAGAFYAYICRGLGKLVGGGAAYVALFAYSILNIGFYGAFAYFTQSTFKDLLHINIPWQVWIFVGIAIIAVLGHRSVNLGANLLLIFLTAEILILAVLSIAVLIKEPGNISAVPFKPSNIFAPGLAVILIWGFGAFTGFESTAIYAEEAKNPERTIPVATYISVGFLALFYGFTVWIATVAFGIDGIMKVVQGPHASDLYFTMSNKFLGYPAFVVMRILIITSILACQIGFHNAVSRYAFSLGREGLLHKALGRAHPKYRSPYIASAAQITIAVLASLLIIIAGGDPYIHLYIWTYGPGVSALVLVQFLTALSVFAFFRKERMGHGVFRVVAAPLIGAVGLGISFYYIQTNYALMTGYSSTITNLPFIVVVPIIFIVGLAMAYRLKRGNPKQYALLATDYV
jgi:amino acid transporter